MGCVFVQILGEAETIPQRQAEVPPAGEGEARFDRETFFSDLGEMTGGQHELAGEAEVDSQQRYPGDLGMGERERQL